MANEIWRLPYTAQQLQNMVTNQVPRINSSTHHWERYDIATGAWVDTGVVADGGIVTGAVSLTTTWTANTTNGWWTQVISIPNILASSVVDLRFTAAQLAQLMDDGCSCSPFAVNDNGTVTVYALGAQPTTAMTVFYTMLGGVGGSSSVVQNSPLSLSVGRISTPPDTIVYDTEEA